MVGSASETLNTIHELAAALKNNKDIVDTLNGAITDKVSKSELNTEIGKVEETIDDINKALNDKANKSDVKSLNNITHGELKSLIASSKLIPGMQYRITDYMTTTGSSNTVSAGHQFDVIVLALSENTLSEESWAIQHKGDTYFANSNLSAWKIWYCLDNDTSRFAWAYSKGKGVIYRMIDEFGNDCPYDFKNILVKHWNDDEIYTGFYYTFHRESNDTDHSISGYCSQNVVKPYLRGAVQYLNRIILFSDTSSTYIRANNFDSYCQKIVGEHHFNFNHFSSGCEEILVGNNCYNNYIGIHCSNIIIGNQAYNNFLGNNCYNISLLGSYIVNNYFEDNCRDIILGSEYSGYYRNNHFCNGVRFVKLYSNETAAYERQIQFLEVSSSIQRTNSHISIEVSRGKVTQTTIAKNSNSEVKQFCLADLV